MDPTLPFQLYQLLHLLSNHLSVGLRDDASGKSSMGCFMLSKKFKSLFEFVVFIQLLRKRAPRTATGQPQGS